jgi:hypothetical protein
MQKDSNAREQMFSMITLWQQSGVSQKSFCEQHNIRYHVFHYWYRCFRDLQVPAKDKGFIPLKIQPPTSENTSCPNVELLLADGKRLLFHSPVSSDYLKVLIS